MADQISVNTLIINLIIFFHLAGALMKHFLEGIAPLRHGYINLDEKSHQS